MASQPFIAQIKMPVAALRPFVLALPPNLPTAPADAELRADLSAMSTPVAKAFLEAYAEFGNKDQFAARLVTAMTALPLPGDPGGHLQPFLVHISRLGAEAFVLDVHERRVSWGYAGFIDEPADVYLGLMPAQQEAFVHFAARRLLEMASASLEPDARRLQMDKSIALFGFFQAQIEFERLAIGSEAIFVAYRELLFKIIQVHYQA